MSTSTWYFSRRRPSGGRARNPQVEKFFRSDVVEDQANAIIREGIQNSLDAGLAEVTNGGKSVNVQIAFGECSFSDMSEFIPGLFEHLDAVRGQFADVPEHGSSCRFMSFEDFNTTGLQGDPYEWDPPDNKNAFFNFFRGEGVTGKEGNQRGRHGVGKLVFSAASRAKSIFGLTATSTGGPMLMGTSTLVLHKCDNVPFDPDGWFGVETPVHGDVLIGPVTDSSLLERFATVFSLDRESFPGLSIVVPWVEESVTPESALYSVVRGFFWPLMQRRLYVDIKNADGTNEPLSADSLPDLIDRLAADSWSHSSDLRKSYNLAKWAIDLPADTIPEASSAEGSQEWRSDLLTEEVKQHFRNELLNNRPIALRVPIRVRKKGESAENATASHFHIFLAHDSESTDGNVQFIREGLLIPGVKCRRYPNYRALVIVEEGHLASFLGDAENPSHTEWQSQNVKDKYTFPAQTLRYVIQSVPNLLKSLHDDQKTADSTLLLDLFSLPATDESSPHRKQQKKSKKKGGETDEVIVDPPPPRPRRFALQKCDSGFVIRRGSVDAELPHTVAVNVAYASRRGNPLKKYRKHDFRLDRDPIEIRVEGGDVTRCADNHLVVQITSPSFEIAAVGFDTNRDLFIDVKVDSFESEVDDAETV